MQNAYPKYWQIDKNIKDWRINRCLSPLAINRCLSPLAINRCLSPLADHSPFFRSLFASLQSVFPFIVFLPFVRSLRHCHCFFQIAMKMGHLHHYSLLRIGFRPSVETAFPVVLRMAMAHGPRPKRGGQKGTLTVVVVVVVVAFAAVAASNEEMAAFVHLERDRCCSARVAVVVFPVVVVAATEDQTKSEGMCRRPNWHWHLVRMNDVQRRADA